MNDPALTLVIVNPTSARAARVWRDLRPVLLARGIRFDEHLATIRGDGADAARRALRAGCRTVVAVGGDGTLSEVASGFFTRAGDDDAPHPVNPDAAIAVLPAGTGDDFARSLQGGTRADVRDWLERLVRHQHAAPADRTARSIDILDGTAHSSDSPTGTVSVRRFICINGATIGIGAEVAARVAGQGRVVRLAGGELRFAIAALAPIVGWRERAVRVLVDDAPPLVCHTNLLAVMNNPFEGGGMMLAPRAEPDDGRLDVVTTDRLTRRALLRELTRIHRGGHVRNPSVRITPGTRVRIETHAAPMFVEADGDVRGHTPVEFRVVPAALRVVV